MKDVLGYTVRAVSCVLCFMIGLTVGDREGRKAISHEQVDHTKEVQRQYETYRGMIQRAEQRATAAEVGHEKTLLQLEATQSALTDLTDSHRSLRAKAAEGRDYIPRAKE